MLPEPLHPAVVHFPIVLACALPLVAVGSWIAIQRGASAVRAWAVVVGIAAVLTGSTWLALRSGEHEEERVEDVVSERAIEAHEEAGERLLALAVTSFVLGVGGLAPGRIGRALRAVAVVATLLPLAGAVQAGRSGGELVYRHDAAAAYASRAGVARVGEPVRRSRGAEDD